MSDPIPPDDPKGPLASETPILGPLERQRGASSDSMAAMRDPPVHREHSREREPRHSTLNDIPVTRVCGET